MRRTAAIDELEQLVQVHGRVSRECRGRIWLDPGQLEAIPPPRGDLGRGAGGGMMLRARHALYATAPGDFLPLRLGRKRPGATDAEPSMHELLDASTNGYHHPATLEPEGGPRRLDLARAEAPARDLLAALGVDLDGAGLLETPRRVVEAYRELLTPEPFDLTTFPNDGGYDELVVVRSIPFHSLCEHHLLPFSGVAHVGYLPGERIVGLSKLARVVDRFARALQVQERLTEQIADALEERLRPRGVGVVLEAEHACMSLRGVRKPEAQTVTSALHGLIRDDPRTRQEFLALAGASGGR